MRSFHAAVRHGAWTLSDGHRFIEKVLAGIGQDTRPVDLQRCGL